MIKFSNTYFPTLEIGSRINKEDLLTDLFAAKTLMLAFKDKGDKVNEQLMRMAYMKRKAFADAHKIDYTIPETEKVKSIH
jgi:hypothetical protein